MQLTGKNILITGYPGVGKTTLIKRLSEELSGLEPVGFYTEEIREGGVRKGFALVAPDGRRGVLAHTGISGESRVGKYGVDTAGFEEFLGSIDFLGSGTSLIILDEIGKMECMSGRFRLLLKEALDSEKTVIATIALKGGGIIEDTKRRRDVVLFEMTRSNRDSLLSQILAPLRK